MENDSTPPPLANVGLHTNRGMTETRNRRFKRPIKLESGSSDDELFVSRPKFKKTIEKADDQKIKQEGEENIVNDDQKIKQEGEENMVTDGQKIKQKGEENMLSDDQQIKQEGGENMVTDDQEEPIEPMNPRLVNFMMGSSSFRWLNHEFGNLVVDEIEILNGKTYDMGTYMDECCPQLKTRILPRRGWQVLRRTLGRARRFSQVFIDVELKEMGLSPLCEPLSQESEDSPVLERGLSPLHLWQEPKDSSSSEQFAYSNKLVESILLAKKLLALKRNALLEIALKNKEIEGNRGSQAWSRSQHRETKTLYQRCFASLYCVNADIMAPMTVLREHLVQYRKEVAEKEARSCTRLEIYRKCYHKADSRLQFAERYTSYQFNTPATRDLAVKLQTILYIMGECEGPNNADLLSLVDCVFSQLSQSLPPELNAQLKESMDELEPYRKRLNDLFKNVPKEKPPTEDTQ